MGLAKFWPDLEISEVFLVGLKNSARFCLSEFRIIFGWRVSDQVSDLSLFLSVLSLLMNSEKFDSYSPGYRRVSNKTVKQNKAVYCWAFASFQWRFHSFFIALSVPLSRIRNFSAIRISGSDFLEVKSRARILKPRSRSLAKSWIYHSTPLKREQSSLCTTSSNAYLNELTPSKHVLKPSEII